MKTVCYVLYSSVVTGSSSSLATADIVRAGKIIGWSFCAGFTGGAGIGQQEVGVALNTNGSAIGGTNNPQREAAVVVNMSTTGNGLTDSVQNALSGLAIPVQGGDRLTLWCTMFNTAPANGYVAVSVYVHED